eukprot:g16728.t1
MKISENFPPFPPHSGADAAKPGKCLGLISKGKLDGRPYPQYANINSIVVSHPGKQVRGVSVLKLVHFTSVSSSSHSPEFTPSQGLDKVVVRHGAPFSPLLVRPGGLAGHIDCLFDYGAVRPGLNPLVIIA